MINRRLSQLQRRILLEAMQNEGRVPKRHFLYKRIWGKDTVWCRQGQHCWAGRDLRTFKYNWVVNKYVASVSRSLRNLEAKGLITRDPYWRRRFEISPVGQQIAQSLLLRTMDIDNKRVGP